MPIIYIGKWIAHPIVHSYNVTVNSYTTSSAYVHSSENQGNTCMQESKVLSLLCYCSQLTSYMHWSAQLVNSDEMRI